MTLLLLALVLSSPIPPDAAVSDECYADCPGMLGSENDRGPAAGALAPRFTAVQFDPATGAVQQRTLEGLLGGRPVILAFGSYT